MEKEQEYEIGKEYEFSDDGNKWLCRKLLVTTDKGYWGLFNDVEADLFKFIRPIKPSVREQLREYITEHTTVQLSEVELDRIIEIVNVK